MLFPTLAFALFFCLIFPIYWLLRSHTNLWRLFILGASYLFYAFWDWRFVGLIMLSTAVNALLARLVAQAQSTARASILLTTVIFNIGLLGLFKYYGFFIDSANALSRLVGLPARLPLVEVLIPVGISFFTFQGLSYVIDVARRRHQPVSLLDFAVYLAFFPHLVAGPIVRVSEFVPQLTRPGWLRRRQITRAGLLISAGLFKKLVIASHLSILIVDPVFAAPSLYTSPEILLAIYAYAIQIFADFSGYTDMAIGLALLLGVRFPLNFNRPYTATSLQDFWRRWHMTLSRWLRDYLYIPLGGNRHGPLATYRTLILTMTLGGLWHGAALTFVVWGLYHGLLLAAERWYSQRSRRRERLPRWLKQVATFHLVCIGWVFFRADSLPTALSLFAQLGAGWGPASLVSAAVVALIIAGLLVQYWPARLERRFAASFGDLPLGVQAVALGAFLALTITLGPIGVAPFIYYQF